MKKGDSPVSPTILGYPLYLSKLLAMSFHSFLNTNVLPVKCNAAKFGLLMHCATTSGGGPGVNWMTPGGMPASRRIWWVM